MHLLLFLDCSDFFFFLVEASYPEFPNKQE